MQKITVSDIKKGNKEKVMGVFTGLFDSWCKDDSEIVKMFEKIASRASRVIKTEDDELLKELSGTLFVGFMKEVTTPRAYELIVKEIFEETEKK